MVVTEIFYNFSSLLIRIISKVCFIVFERQTFYHKIILLPLEKSDFQIFFSISSPKSSATKMSISPSQTQFSHLNFLLLMHEKNLGAWRKKRMGMKNTSRWFPFLILCSELFFFHLLSHPVEINHQLCFISRFYLFLILFFTTIKIQI